MVKKDDEELSRLDGDNIKKFLSLIGSCFDNESDAVEAIEAAGRVLSSSEGSNSPEINVTAIVAAAVAAASIKAEQELEKETEALRENVSDTVLLAIEHLGNRIRQLSAYEDSLSDDLALVEKARSRILEVYLNAAEQRLSSK